jgi:hypothetical protein
MATNSRFVGTAEGVVIRGPDGLVKWPLPAPSKPGQQPKATAVRVALGRRAKRKTK